MAYTDYAYAVGRIRALEIGLIPDNLLERLMSVASAQEALQVLAETEYGAVAHDGDYETLIEDELLRVYQLLQELAPASEAIKVFRFRWDLHNIKLLAAGGNGKPSRLGNFPWEVLWEMLNRADYSRLPVEFQTVLNQFQEAESSSAAQLDQAYYSYGKRVLCAKEGILRDYWLARLDLTNLRLLVRLRKVGAPLEDFVKFMVAHGLIAQKEWLEVYGAPWEAVVAWLGYKPYHSIARDGVASLTDLPVLEREIDNYLLERLDRAKWVALGVEPLIAYLLAKETEAKNLRLILAGKSNRLSTETVKRRLRRGYI
ncbi:MAG TPA: hypothetical protein GX391_02995 [Firmicutes bacterium]|mgnify:FL=1|nr:hypothetical protein [Bacillota bacterium]HOQ23896.1 V-type ATPase subunit [Bacillota bacterium]HPT67148.1 V-type ATPase subunit [Bacillota bacterium]